LFLAGAVPYRLGLAWQVYCKQLAAKQRIAEVRRVVALPDHASAFHELSYKLRRN
jgi:hypothetical protein